MRTNKEFECCHLSDNRNLLMIREFNRYSFNKLIPFDRMGFMVKKSIVECLWEDSFIEKEIK